MAVMVMQRFGTFAVAPQAGSTFDMRSSCLPVESRTSPAVAHRVVTELSSPSTNRSRHSERSTSLSACPA